MSKYISRSSVSSMAGAWSTVCERCLCRSKRTSYTHTHTQLLKGWTSSSSVLKANNWDIDFAFKTAHAPSSSGVAGPKRPPKRGIWIRLKAATTSPAKTWQHSHFNSCSTARRKIQGLTFEALMQMRRLPQEDNVKLSVSDNLKKGKKSIHSQKYEITAQTASKGDLCQEKTSPGRCSV